MTFSAAISRLRRREREARALSRSGGVGPYVESCSPWVRAGLVAAVIASAALISVEISASSRTLVGAFALLPLLLAMRLFSPGWAMACGALWGASLFGFSAATGSPAVPLSAFSLALLAAAPAGYAYAMVWLARRYGFNPWMLALGWGLVEFALAPLGLPGGLLGSTAGFASGGTIHVLQGVLGYVCVAALIVAVNAIALALLGRAYQRVCGGGRRVVRSAPRPRRRIFPPDVAVPLWFVPRPGRPRAPPAW